MTRGGMGDCDFFRRCPENTGNANGINQSLIAGQANGSCNCEPDYFWLWVALGVLAWHAFNKK
jgi:hypothetical protein